MEDVMIVLQKHYWTAYGYVGGTDEWELKEDIKLIAIVKDEKEGEKYVKGWKKNRYGEYEIGKNDEWFERRIMEVGEEW